MFLSIFFFAFFRLDTYYGTHTFEFNVEFHTIHSWHQEGMAVEGTVTDKSHNILFAFFPPTIIRKLFKLNLDVLLKPTIS